MQLKRSAAPSRELRQVIGEGAGVLFWGLLSAAVLGGLWAVVRPAYVTRVADGEVLIDELASPANVEFASLGGFACASALLGVLVAILALRARSQLGIGMMAWACVVAEFAALALLVVGEFGVGLLHPMPGHEVLGADNGAIFEVVPALYPGVALLVAPFVTGLGYWLAELRNYYSETNLPVTPIR